jgi:aryl-alcohol dehydrogenase-like predicted oxidoreductase
VLDAAKSLDITIVAYWPLASGLLTAKFHRNPALLRRAPIVRRVMLRRGIEQSRPLIDALEAIAADHDATPAQIALNWLIHSQGDMVVAIPGASRVEHAEENAAAMRLRLSETEMARLDQTSRELD